MKVDVKKCARCGEDHDQMEFFEFSLNPVNEFTHFGACPNTGEPVLMQIVVNLAKTAQVVPADL